LLWLVAETGGQFQCRDRHITAAAQLSTTVQLGKVSRHGFCRAVR
jgi:hypothetical protein